MLKAETSCLFVSLSVAYASEMCDVLNQDLFSACHEHLSPTVFHQQCRSDTCKCGTPCLCSALAHYAHHCRRFSVIVDFRSRVPDCGGCSAKSPLLQFSLSRPHVCSCLTGFCCCSLSLSLSLSLCCYSNQLSCHHALWHLCVFLPEPLPRPLCPAALWRGV